MSFEAIVTLAVIVVALALFVSELVDVDVVALGMVFTLVATGVISPSEGLRGFANPAIITVAAMFALSDALMRAGVVTRFSPVIKKLLHLGYRRSVSGLMALVGGMSAFINNTPVVATFIPILSSASREIDKPSPRFLIPLSYGAILGGTCTLIGTSTNLLVDGMARTAGDEGFSLFTLTPIGLIFSAVGITYMTLLGRKLVTERSTEESLESSDQIRNYQAEVRVTEDLDDSRRAIGDLLASDEPEEELEALGVLRGKEVVRKPDSGFELKKDDVLLVHGDFERIRKLVKTDSLSVRGDGQESGFPNEETRLVEIVITPTSDLVGQRLGEAPFRQRYDAHVLAIRTRGEDLFSHLDNVRLRPGDILLLQATDRGLKTIGGMRGGKSVPFLPMSETELEPGDAGRLRSVLLTLAAVVLLAAFDVLPIAIAAMGGVLALAVGGVITTRDAYRAVDWQVIILIAGALSLGAAIEKSGLAALAGQFLEHSLGASLGPVAVVSAIYLMTSLLTEVISNNAAAALLAPVALSLSSSMGIDATPLLVAIALAGSASFTTPVGYQTNTMVYSAGNYRFYDFAKVGGPLNVIFWIVATLLIPLIYPL